MIILAVPSGIPLHLPIPEDINPSTSAFSTIEGSEITNTAATGGPNPAATQSEPFDNRESFDDQHMSDNIPHEPLSSEPRRVEARRVEAPLDPAASEADRRATIWSEHSEAMKQIKDDVDSMLATLWARDTDPRDLQDLFTAMKKEVKQTRLRLLS
jgi:hypothetical protein